MALGGPVHDHVPVAFQQAHEAADLVERLALLGRGQQSHQTSLVEGVMPFPGLHRRPFQGLEEPLGVGVDAFDQRVHQASGNGAATRARP